MALLDYDTVCRMDIPDFDSPAGFIVFFEKTNSEYTLHLPEELKDLENPLIDHLHATNASDTSCTRLFNLDNDTSKRLSIKMIEHYKSCDNNKSTSENLPTQSSEINSEKDNEFKGCKKNHNQLVQWICLSSILSKSANSVRLASSAACALLKKSGAVNFILNPVLLPDQAAIGACLSLYNYTALKGEKPKKLFVGCTCSNKIFNFGMRCAYYQNIARFLSDTPANLLTPRLFCEYALKIGTEAGLNVTSHDEEYIRKKDMNLFLSVSAGSNEPPMYLTAEYHGRSENSNENDSEKDQNSIKNLSPDEQKASHEKTEESMRDENFAFDICLIGKGVTFDSGGISLKPSLNMAEMKGDMQGAAASFCAACLVADQKLNLNLLVEIPLTENMPGSKATKPGDVKKAMNSLTVEIDNTDAEGRLILADALTHAQEKNPRIIIDTATLTGAMRVALGGVFAGLFTRNDDLASEIIQSGIEAEDKVWRMPLTEEYENDIRSEVADLKNMGERGSAGSTAGAEFLRRFVKTKNWAHIDIASTMTKAEPKSIFAKGMSGRGTLLLYKICERLSRN